MPGTLLALAMLTQPESPRWLIKAGKLSKARAILSKIRNLPEEHPYLRWEVQSIEAQLAHEMQGRLGANKGLAGIMRETMAPENRNRLFLGVIMMFIQNLVSLWPTIICIV